MIHRHLRYSCRWDISQRRTERLLLNAISIVSAGSIPITEKDLEEQEQLIQDLGLVAELPTLAARQEKEEKGDKKDKFPSKKEVKQRARRSYRSTGKKNFHESFLEESEKERVQVEDTRILLTFRLDPRIKSEFKMRYTFNFIDPAVAPKQPRHVSEVKLTYRNAREAGDIPADDKDTEDIYHDCHQVLDVTASSYDSLLKILFGHNQDEPTYFTALRNSVKESGHKLYLICMPMNEQPYTTNVFNLRNDMPVDHSDLSIALRQKPRVFMLVRGSDLDEKTLAIIEEFTHLAHFDPTSDFFDNPHQRILNNSAVKGMSELPKFSTTALHSFETYEEFELHTGMAQLIEHRFSAGEHTYTGRAACIPMPKSYNAQFKLPMVYVVTFSMDKASRKLPALLEGAAVHVDFSKDPNVTGQTWFGKVMPNTSATSMGSITIYVHRPVQDNELLDSNSYSRLTSRLVDQMSPAETQQWAGQQKLPIKVLTDNDTKEMKRVANNYARMVIPDHLVSKNILKAELLGRNRQLLTCNDHRNYTQTSLYDGINDPLLPQAKLYVHGRLLPHQDEAVTGWEDNGIYERLAVLIGPSGSGKTTAIDEAILPYLLETEMTEEEANAIDQQLYEHFQIKEEARNRRLAKKAGEANNDDARTDGDWEKRERPGAITICAMQNETVDKQYLGFKKRANDFAQAMGLPVFLGVRVYSEYSELNAVLAMLRPNYSFEPDDTAFFLNNTNADHLGPVNKNLLSTYLKATQGSEFEGIKDKRFTLIRDSMAYNIMMLAQVPGFPPSPALQASFSAQELSEAAAETRDLVLAQRDWITDGELSSEAAARAKKAALVAYRIILRRAAYVVTTLSTATSNGFNVFRHATALVCEESGRASDADMVGIFSQYPFVKVRVLSGDPKQLPPMMFGNELENNFYTQGSLSLLARLFTTGFSVPMLQLSSRFKNPLLLEVCRIANDAPTLAPVAGSFDHVATAEAAQIMKAIWKVNSPAVFINVVGSTIQQSATESAFNIECVITAMHSIESRLNRGVLGKHISYITPYNAQLHVAQVMREHARQDAVQARNSSLAEQWSDVVMSTIDSYMGCDNDYVILDYAAHVGFAFDLPRFLVANTRARLSAEYIGDTEKFTRPTSGIKAWHPVRSIIRTLNNVGAIVRVEAAQRQKFSQYGAALEGLGLETEGKRGIRLPANTVLGASKPRTTTHLEEDDTLLSEEDQHISHTLEVLRKQ
ncbi:hypothetical protein BKA63DRAFT_413075 [Paraphoma chrysanthemicola]|nr:hypothetical protein BKA63DRAFT_413075 [Paraphoma chrysanthemicola]